MANRIAGITVEINGDTTKLSAALKSVNSEIRSTQSELKDVNRLLKLDPGNADLMAQKQRLLRDAIAETKEKLEQLKVAAQQANEKLANGEMIQGQYDALQREIVETEQKLKGLEEQTSKSAVALQKIAATGEKLKNVGDKIIGNLTVIMLDAFVYSYKFYSGQMTADEFADLMTEEIVIALASQAAGSVAQLLIPLPGVYFAASLGASLFVSANYAQGKDVVVALTDNYGFDMITPVKNTGKEALSKLEVAKNSLVDAVPYLKSLIKKDYNVALVDVTSE